jgi:hypothetical protein
MNARLVIAALTTIILCQSIPANGQQAGAGFFSVINAVDSITNTIVSVDRKPLRPDGLKPAKVTGGLGFPVGSHRIEAMNGDAKPATLSLSVSPSASPLVIIYQVLSRDSFGRATRELRMLSLANGSPATRKTFSAVYVGTVPLLQIAANGQMKILKPLIPVSLGEAASMTVTQGDKRVGTFSAEGAENNYVLVLFDDQNANISGTVAEDIIYKRAGR